MDLDGINTYFLKKGFEQDGRDKGTEGVILHREYRHPTLGLTARLDIRIRSADVVGIELYFFGNSISKPRTSKYSSVNISSLYTRIDRVCREAKRYLDHQEDSERKREEAIERLKTKILKVSTQVEITDSGSPWAVLDVAYRGFTFHVSKRLEVELRLGETRYEVSLGEALAIIDLLHQNDLVPDEPEFD